MSELEGAQLALRSRVAITRSPGTQLLRISGEDARAAALWLLPSRLHLRDAEARQSLLLDETGRPLADVVVCLDDESYLLLVDGPIDALAHARANLVGDAEVVDLSATHESLDLHGPWAWELLAEVLGSDMVALPYLNFFRIDEGTCVRAGRTGEFGYHVVVPRDAGPALRARFLSAGQAFDLAEVDAADVSVCGFENWFFDAAHVPAGATPIELGLEWRLASDRDFLGRAALDAHRPRSTLRQVCLVATQPLAAGEAVMLGGRRLGEITRAAWSPARGEWIASALVPRELAHGGIDRFTVRGAGVRTVAPPLLDNRSLYVDPRRHAYVARDELRFGPLVRDGRARMEPLAR